MSQSLAEQRARRVASVGGLPVLVGGLAMVVLPVLAGGPPDFARGVATDAFIYGLFVVSWDLFSGLTGELSFGHTLWIGTAAFATALLQTRWNMPPLAALFCGAAVGGVAGVTVGLLTWRHTGVVFTMLTMAAQLVFQRCIYRFSDIFGAEQGVLHVRRLFSSDLAAYRCTAALSVGGLILCCVLKASRFGRALRASGGDTRVAQASGVPVPLVRLAGAALAGTLAGLAGSSSALEHQQASAELAGDSLAGLIFLLALIGGTGTIVGPWCAAVVIFGFVIGPLRLQPAVFFGILLILVWVAPSGLYDIASRGVRGWLRKPGSNAPS
jgi:ABC-type branched-subunit amino acid transport system permease subunit